MTPSHVLAQRVIDLEMTIEVQTLEIRSLRRQLTLEVDIEEVRTLARRLGVNHGEATILWALYRSDGRAVSADRLLEALEANDHARERHIKQVAVRVYWIRRKLGRGLIDSTLGARGGYWITPAGRERVARALGEHQGETHDA